MIESDILNWQKMFVEQTTRMNEEGERQAKSATPYPRPQKDAYKAINRYEQQSAKIAISSSQAEFELRQNFISNKEHFCSKKLEDLVPIKLKEMHVNKIHTGRFLLCRVIRDPFYITGTLVLIQDSDNQVENLSLYNFSSSYKIDAKLLLPNNSIIIIKEPFLKNMLSSPTDFHIRVESPTDLIILSNLDKDDKNAQYFLDKWTDIKDSDRSLSFDELNKKGNVFFVGKNYHSAIRYYTKALNLAREDKTVNNSDVKKTLNNRAAALLKLDKYFQAYQDTVKSTQIENVNDTRDVANNEKAFYRMGKAAYSMRQFDVALEAFEKCLALNVKNKDAGEEVIRSKKRLAERSTGKYDMKSVIEHALVQKQPRLDLADFVSDDIEIRNVNNNPNYKGVFAKNDIKAKTLLVASKAASISFKSDWIKNNCVTYNSYTKTAQKPSQTANFSNLITILQNDPYLSKEFYKLYSGPVISRVEPIDELVIDTSRVQAIITFNSFSRDPHFSEFESISLDDTDENESGIWIIPSFFNHSCVPNGQRFFYSDIMMIYANKNIKKGEEIQIKYVSRDSLEQRDRLRIQYGFDCKCELCELDIKDPNVHKRENLIKQRNKTLIQKLRIGRDLNINEAKEYVSEMKSLYEGSKSQRDNSLKIDLISPMMLHAEFILRQGKIIQASEAFMEVYEFFKNSRNEFSVLTILLRAISAYWISGMHDKAFEVMKLAIDTFIGDKEDVKYTILKRFSHDKNFPQILELL